MSVEQLLFLVLFVLIPLINVLRRVLRKRPTPPVPEAVRAESMPALPPPRVLQPVPEFARPPARATAAERRPAEVAEQRRQTPYRFSPSAVRRGIVLMTILGPCRALEPEATPETRA
ncbi:MAG: hypothetical protein ACREKS_18970 [Candidatus Rokuibacteriota bacterium]